jgi:hypothetical protein
MKYDSNIPFYYLDISSDFYDDSEVDFIALVDKPAIQKNFLKFADSFSDYPESVKNTAQKALDWANENGWGTCGTQVGKTRANQLASGEPISLDTIQRMYSYLSRHKVDLESSLPRNVALQPGSTVVYTAILYGITAPVLIAIILHISNNKKIMGKVENSRMSNILGFTTLVIMAVASITLLYLQF